MTSESHGTHDLNMSLAEAQILQPDVVAEFLHRLRQIRIDAHREHERIRKAVDDRQAAHDRLQKKRERDELKRRADFDRETDELVATLGQDIADLRMQAMKQADIIARADLAIEVDTPRQPPVLTGHEESGV